MFDKVLVANGGDRDPRLPDAARARHRLGGRLSEGDRAALHVAYAARRSCWGRRLRPRATSRSTGFSTLRSAPGAGRHPATASSPKRFLCAGRGGRRVRWIGPPPAAIELMGIKTAARTAMQAAGVPIIPGTTDRSAGRRAAPLGDELGYPLLIKAAAGGGGKGMEEVHDPAQAEQAFARARRRAVVLREPGRLRREADRRPAACRGAGARRLARQRRPPRRARLHDPAAPPEADRGDAVARRSTRSYGNGSARSASRRPGRAAIAPPGRSRACSRRTATTSSWR